MNKSAIAAVETTHKPTVQLCAISVLTDSQVMNICL